jgi:hypothetical protein
VVVKRWRRKGCGQNRMGVCHEGRQGQTQRAMVVQKDKVLLPFGQRTLVLPFAENKKIKGYRTVIWPVVVYGCGV